MSSLSNSQQRAASMALTRRQQLKVTQKQTETEIQTLLPLFSKNSVINTYHLYSTKKGKWEREKASTRETRDKRGRFPPKSAHSNGQYFTAPQNERLKREDFSETTLLQPWHQLSLPVSLYRFLVTITAVCSVKAERIKCTWRER